MLNGYGKYLKKHGISQVDLARADGVSRQVVNYRSHAKFDNIRFCQMESLANFVNQTTGNVMGECAKLEKESVSNE